MMSSNEWKKIEEKYKAMKMSSLEELDIDITDLENLIKEERNNPKQKSKPQGKGKQKEVHQEPTEQLDKLNKTQLKEFDKNHNTNLRKCALLLDAKYVKRDENGNLIITGKRSEVEGTYRMSIGDGLPEHLKSGQTSYSLNTLLAIQKLVDMLGYKTGKGYRSKVPEKDVSDEDKKDVGDGANPADKGEGQVEAKVVHVDPEKDVSDKDKEDDGDGAAIANPVGKRAQADLDESESETARSDEEVMEQQMIDITEAILDPNTIEESRQDIERITSSTQTEQTEQISSQSEIQTQNELNQRMETINELLAEIKELQQKNQEYDKLASDLIERLGSGVNPSATKGTGTETPSPEAEPEEEYEPAAAPSAVQEQAPEQPQAPPETPQEATADREAQAEQRLPARLKYGSQTETVDALLAAVGVEVKPPSITPLDDIEKDKKQEVPSKEQEKYGRHEKIPWHGHNVPWDKIINNLDWKVYPKMPVYDYEGWSNYESVWGGTA